jgi:hypothetical protein
VARRIRGFGGGGRRRSGGGALLLAQGFNNEPIKYDTVMEALAALAVGSGVVALGAMAAWVGRATIPRET